MQGDSDLLISPLVDAPIFIVGTANVKRNYLHTPEGLICDETHRAELMFVTSPCIPIPEIGPPESQDQLYHTTSALVFIFVSMLSILIKF